MPRLKQLKGLEFTAHLQTRWQFMLTYPEKTASATAARNSLDLGR